MKFHRVNKCHVPRRCIQLLAVSSGQPGPDEIGFMVKVSFEKDICTTIFQKTPYKGDGCLTFTERESKIIGVSKPPTIVTDEEIVPYHGEPMGN